ncbi:MAG: EamA family transporter [Ectobacillus sp.]
MRASIRHYVYLHAAFLLYSLIMLYMKWSSQFPFNTFAFFAAYFFLVVFLFAYALIWQQVIKHFEISKAYSQRGVIILWTLLWSVLFFDEPVKWNHLLGAFIIILGIVVVTKDE